MHDFRSSVDLQPIKKSQSRSRDGRGKLLWGCAAAVVIWFGLSEIATSAWYHWREAKLSRNPLPASGEIVIERLRDYVSTSGSAASEKSIGDTAIGILKCSYGRTLLWSGDAGPMAVTTLKWSDQSTVSGVESMHNPGNCLKAAGWAIGARTDYGVEKFGAVTAEVTQWEVSRGDLHMLAYSAVFRRFAELSPGGGASTFWRHQRLQPVLDGRRDAPVYIVLAYLPMAPNGDEAEVHARFQHIMQAIFHDPASIVSAN